MLDRLRSRLRFPPGPQVTRSNLLSENTGVPFKVVDIHRLTLGLNPVIYLFNDDQNYRVRHFQMPPSATLRNAQQINNQSTASVPL